MQRELREANGEKGHLLIGHICCSTLTAHSSTPLARRVADERKKDHGRGTQALATLSPSQEVGRRRGKTEEIGSGSRRRENDEEEEEEEQEEEKKKKRKKELEEEEEEQD